METVRRLESKLADPLFHEEMLVIPVKKLLLRAAKYDVVLRESSVRAVHAMHTILSRMVMFHCKCCRERFPTFHPAYDPSEYVDLQLMRRNNHDVARGVQHRSGDVGDCACVRRDCWGAVGCKHTRRCMPGLSCRYEETDRSAGR